MIINRHVKSVLRNCTVNAAVFVSRIDAPKTPLGKRAALNYAQEPSTNCTAPLTLLALANGQDSHC